MADRKKIIVVGAGIVGLATALHLSQRWPGQVLVLEKESAVARHQTGNNSGVIHSGLYYRPGSLKAATCVRGREALYRFCQKHNINYEQCGKVVVATSAEELPRLAALAERGRANGLRVEELDSGGIRRREPHCRGLAGLWVPETGIVDYKEVALAYARQIEANGGQILTGARVLDIRQDTEQIRVAIKDKKLTGQILINCAGLQADRIAQLAGYRPKLQIVPFRGEYYELNGDKEHLVRGLIYPVPDPRFPFLGVHFTRIAGGGVEAGPNAVLAFAREGYRHRQIKLRDLAQTLSYAGFWRLAARYWRMGLMEFYRSFSKAAFVRALQKLVPEIRAEDVHRAGAGVRAQALAPDGRLLDDFEIARDGSIIHVLNAPSPAATASLAIGEEIAAQIE